MPEEKIAKIKTKILKYQTLIRWRNNATCSTIKEMVAAAKMDLDAGLEQTLALMPDRGFHCWVSYCFIFTRLFNRDRPDDEPALLDIIRTALNKWTPNVCLLFIYLLFIYLQTQYSCISPLSDRCAPSNA